MPAVELNPENGSIASVNDSASSSGSSTPKSALTPEEYFSDYDLNGKDIGRPQKISTKVLTSAI